MTVAVGCKGGGIIADSGGNGGVDFRIAHRADDDLGQTLTDGLDGVVLNRDDVLVRGGIQLIGDALVGGISGSDLVALLDELSHVVAHVAVKYRMKQIDGRHGLHHLDVDRLRGGGIGVGVGLSGPCPLVLFGYRGLAETYGVVHHYTSSFGADSDDTTVGRG